MNKFSLFSVTGIELEYMIIHRDTLMHHPIADKLLVDTQHHIVNELDYGPIAISNELALHVIELKTQGPVADLTNVDQMFHHVITQLNEQLRAYDCCLLPTGAHPFLNPSDGVALWPHGDRIIYETYHRLFNCTGHGWSNLQSAHINLPFANNDEFVCLHDTIRLLLPILPALTASTPFIESKASGLIDTRLSFYGSNQPSVPVLAGDIIPESVRSIEDYYATILAPMFQALAPLDPEGILQYEWANSRAAIARFDRDAIEIRIMDTQEAPCADIACIATIIAVLKNLINNAKQSAALSSPRLRVIYEKCIAQGTSAQIDDSLYLRALGLNTAPKTALEIWSTLIDSVKETLPPAYQTHMAVICKEGNLAERMLKAYQHEDLMSIYSRLRDCLAQNTAFHAAY